MSRTARDECDASVPMQLCTGRDSSGSRTFVRVNILVLVPYFSLCAGSEKWRHELRRLLKSLGQFHVMHSARLLILGPSRAYRFHETFRISVQDGLDADAAPLELTSDVSTNDSLDR